MNIPAIGTPLSRGGRREWISSAPPAKAGVASAAKENITGAVTAAGSLSRQMAAGLLLHAREAFTAGLQAAALLKKYKTLTL